MRALIAAGIFPLCFVVGSLALRFGVSRPLRLSRFGRAVLAPAVGIAALTPLLVILGEVGAFSPLALGAAGWISTAIMLGAGRLRRHRGRWHRGDAAVLVLAIAFVAVAALGRDEPWGAGRDQQVYAEFAVALSARGDARVSLPRLDAADQALIAAIGGDTGVRRHLGIVRAGSGVQPSFVSYLPTGWPVWLASAHAIAGEQGLYATNVLFAALGALLLYVVASPIVGRALAVGAAGALLALPSTLWIAGITLSEPLAMALWLALTALIAAAGWRVPGLVAFVAFAGAIVRIDSLAIVPGILTALVVDTALRGEDVRGTRRTVLALCASIVATLVWYRVFHATYLAHKIDYVAVIAGIGVALTAALFLMPTGVARAVGRALESTVARGSACVAVVAAFVYALLLRPSLTPFSLIQNGTTLDGTRDFREDSLWNLAAYLGWPLIMLALSGICVALWRWPRPGSSASRRVLLAVTLLFALLYLWFPLVSPDHPWAVRRFVPVVIPGVVFFAAYAVRRIAGGRGRFAVAGGAILLVLAVAVWVEYGTALLVQRENAGVGRSIDELARELPAALVVADLPTAELAGALLVAHGKQVLVADLRDDATRSAILRWIEAKATSGATAWLLHHSGLSLAGIEAREALRRHFVRDFATPATRAPARGMERREFDVVLSRVDGIDRDVLFRRFGAAPIWGVAESGFLATELTQFGLLRLTDGHAILRVPAAFASGAVAMTVDLFLWAPTAKPSHVQIRIDGRTGWEGQVAPGLATLRIPYVSRPTPEDIAVEIVSDTFDTRSIDPNDRRGPVGIALLGMRLERGGPPVDATPGIDGFRSRLAFEPGSVPARIPQNGASLVLSAVNVGTRPWPSLREHGPDGAVRIGLRWFRKGMDSAPVAEGRSDLAVTLLPGEGTQLPVRLAPIEASGTSLPPGDYTIRVGMLREKHAWFADGGDSLLTFDATVTP